MVRNGGTVHIEVIPPVFYNGNWKTGPAVENISIQGFKFTEVGETNLFIYGTNETAAILNDDNIYGASVSVSDCMFFVSCEGYLFVLIDGFI